MKRVVKSDLPQKTCAVCGRPFAWRTKWAKVWDEVRYCSDACRRRRSGKTDFAEVSSVVGGGTLPTRQARV